MTTKICGKLRLTTTGRYSIYHELHSGDLVEVYVDDRWEKTRVECSKGKYVFANGYPMRNALIRLGGDDER